MKYQRHPCRGDWSSPRGIPLRALKMRLYWKWSRVLTVSEHSRYTSPPLPPSPPLGPPRGTNFSR
ncbi:MAG: hypothetical protein MZV64_34495 [Ignavibacteriales bacterium]|nr:hypothetical protein [Ignavibacteriales bacterium]